MLQALEKFGAVPPVSVAILDRSGQIVAVNDAWKDFGQRYGLLIPNFGIGASYLDYCGSDSKDAPQLVKDLSDLLAGNAKLLTRIYPCNSPTDRRWFYLIGLPLTGQERSGVALIHLNLTPFLPLPSRVEKLPETCEAIDFAAIAAGVESSSVDALSSQVLRMLAPGQVPSNRLSDDDVQQVLDLAGLSKRQLEILGLLAEGKTNTEIARTLSRSPNTIKLHVSAILRQLKLKSRTQAALLASKHLNQRVKGVHPPAQRPLRAPNR